jgi:P27 family predicted phage terminase small subunit
MPGRPLKPTKVKQAQGTSRKCRETKNEMLPAKIDGIPAPPDALMKNEQAMKLWTDSVVELERLDMLHYVDLGVLAAYCIEMANYFNLTADCEKYGRVDKKTNRRRAEDIARLDSLKEAIKLTDRLGFNPASRTKISMPEKKKDNQIFDE